MLNQLLLLALVYVGYLSIWAIVNLLAFALSVAFKKPVILSTVLGITALAVQLVGFVVGIGILWFVISLLLNGQFLWFMFMLFIGIGLLSGLLGFLQMPFILISGYFASKMEDMSQGSGIEVIGENNETIKVLSDDSANQKLAIYFLAVYGLNLLSVLINTEDYPTWQWGDYIAWPVVWVFTQAIFFGLIIGIYMKLRHGKFWYPTKKRMMISTLKTTTIVLIAFTVLLIFFGVWVP
ncbi:MAG: hypothetical protein A3E36_02345 [Candidatus Andersenbacteria bacterium RIFCSPHIGHO2_12_FULL_45_11b]|uniref:Uncharacterized protein n=1 Tax=Candidatus Andersenbacteria bacterium RIFCSPHIGHO2_12_FULL_45_11b TaxID=1797282 RepID=A0A1G1XDT8_9BACT|nr:MAG: hypothetical protein A3E36_02345 [Candidatus Andersenbacteria bacterium RIFCSPHIGHO2_12_FULL_45_11b]